MMSYPEDSVQFAPATCDVNKVGFILLGVLSKTKQRIENDHHKYYCHICERSYLTSSNLRRHMRTIHDNIYSCPKCEMEFTGWKAFRKLQLHRCGEEVKEQPAPLYHCDLCGHTASSRENLVWHLEIHRKLDIDIDDIFA